MTERVRLGTDCQQRMWVVSKSVDGSNPSETPSKGCEK